MEVRIFPHETSDSSLSEDEENRIDDRAREKKRRKIAKRRRNEGLVEVMQACVVEELQYILLYINYYFSSIVFLYR